MADFDPEKMATDGALFDDTNPTDSPPKLTLQDRIVRYSMLKHNQTRLVQELADLANPEANRFIPRLSDCGNFLTFRDYYTVSQVKLVRACFCKKHTLCQLCAVRRSAKFMESTLPKLQHLIDAHPEPLHPHLIVLTVKNGPDCAERVRHIEASWQRLLMRKRNHRTYPNTALRSIVGGVFSLEVTNIGNGWHPHINLLVLSNSTSFDWSAWKDEWYEITGDSRVINFSTDSHRLENTLAETVKYVTKFGDLDGPKLWELHCALRGKRTIRGFGKLHGLRTPEKLTDDVLSADLPYIEYICRYLGSDGYTIYNALRCAAGASEAKPSVQERAQRARFRRLHDGGRVAGE